GRAARAHPAVLGLDSTWRATTRGRALRLHVAGAARGAPARRARHSHGSHDLRARHLCSVRRNEAHEGESRHRRAECDAFDKRRFSVFSVCFRLFPFVSLHPKLFTPRIARPSPGEQQLLGLATTNVRYETNGNRRKQTEKTE